MANAQITITANTKQAEAALGRLNKSLGGISRTATLVGTAITGIVTGGILKSIVQTTAKFQDLRTTLASVTGGAKQGAEAFDFINRFATKTQFGVEELTTTYIKLQTAGITPTEKLLTTFTDAAAVTTDQLGSLQAITDLFARTTGGGLGLEELNRLADRGIPVWSMLEEKLGRNRGQLSELGKTAEGAKIITDALTQSINERFGGATANRINNVSTQFSNLQIAIRKASDAIGSQGFAKLLGDTAVKITLWIEENKKLVEQIGVKLTQGTLIFIEILTFLAKNIGIIIKLFAILIAIKVANFFLTAGLAALQFGIAAVKGARIAITAMAGVTAATATTTAATGAATVATGGFFATIGRWGGAILKGLGKVAGFVLKRLLGPIGLAIAAVEALGWVWNKVFGDAEKTTDEVDKGLGDVKKTADDTNGIFSDMKGILESLGVKGIDELLEGIENSKAEAEKLKLEAQEIAANAKAAAEGGGEMNNNFKDAADALSEVKKTYEQVLAESEKALAIARIEAQYTGVTKDLKLIELELGKELTAAQETKLSSILRETAELERQKKLREDFNKALASSIDFYGEALGLIDTKKLDEDLNLAKQTLENELNNEVITRDQHNRYLLELEAEHQRRVDELKEQSLRKRIQNEMTLERGLTGFIINEKDRRVLQRIGEQERISQMVNDRIEFEKKSELEKTQWAIEQTGNALTALGKYNKTAFQAAKAFNIANAIMNTYMGATKALATYPPPFNFIAAAAVVASGLAQVASIRSQTYSGRALGGPVMNGTSYMVGENGPELFTPTTNGSITRNGDLSGGAPVNVNFTIVANDTTGFDELLTSREGVIRSIISDAMEERGQRSMV